MREIKFRAWLCDEMVSDPIIYGVKGDQLACGSCLNEGINNFIDDGEGKFVLMQYTGLKDKNGFEIYEGDVCKVDQSEENYLVIWKGIGLWFECQDRKECFVFTPKTYWIEVIGNIYENPGLLK